MEQVSAQRGSWCFSLLVKRCGMKMDCGVPQCVTGMKISKLWREFLVCGRGSSGLRECSSLLSLFRSACRWRLSSQSQRLSRVYLRRTQVMNAVNRMRRTKAVKRMRKVLKFEVWRQTSVVIFIVIYWFSYLLGVFFLSCENYSQPFLLSFSFPTCYCSCQPYLKNAPYFFSSSPSWTALRPITIFLKLSSSRRLMLMQCVEKVVQLCSWSWIFAVSNMEGVYRSEPSLRSVSTQKRVPLRDGFSCMQRVKLSRQQFTSLGAKQKYRYSLDREAGAALSVSSCAGSRHCLPRKPSRQTQRQSFPGRHLPPLRHPHASSCATASARRRSTRVGSTRMGIILQLEDNLI